MVHMLHQSSKTWVIVRGVRDILVQCPGQRDNETVNKDLQSLAHIPPVVCGWEVHRGLRYREGDEGGWESGEATGGEQGSVIPPLSSIQSNTPYLIHNIEHLLWSREEYTILLAEMEHSKALFNASLLPQPNIYGKHQGLCDTHSVCLIRLLAACLSTA